MNSYFMLEKDIDRREIEMWRRRMLESMKVAKHIIWDQCSFYYYISLVEETFGAF